MSTDIEVTVAPAVATISLEVATGSPGATGAQGPAPWTFVGAYDNGLDYGIGDAVTYLGGFYYRTGNPSNPGYPPKPGTINESWTPVADRGEPGPAGIDGAPGADGTDASVTSANITTALGYTPADAANPSNPFNQSLNTTDSPTFQDIYLNTYDAYLGSFIHDVSTNAAGYIAYGSNISSLYNDAGYITSSGNPFDQSLNTTDTPTFANGNFVITQYGDITSNGDFSAQAFSINGQDGFNYSGAARFGNGAFTIDAYGSLNATSLGIGGTYLTNDSGTLLWNGAAVGGNPFDQSLNKTDSPTFAGLFMTANGNLDSISVGDDGQGFQTFFISQSGSWGWSAPSTLATQGWVGVQLSGYASSGSIPANVSQLYNDAGYVQNAGPAYLTSLSIYGGLSLLNADGSASFGPVTINGTSGGTDGLTILGAGLRTGYNGGGTPNFTIDDAANITQGNYGTGSMASGNFTWDASGKIAINNAVSSSVDNVVTNKVEIVIGGTTYYLLATTSSA
jgi:hypothetical protein